MARRKLVIFFMVLAFMLLGCEDREVVQTPQLPVVTQAESWDQQVLFEKMKAHVTRDKPEAVARTFTLHLQFPTPAGLVAVYRMTGMDGEIIIGDIFITSEAGTYRFKGRNEYSFPPEKSDHLAVGIGGVEHYKIISGPVYQEEAATIDVEFEGGGNATIFVKDQMFALIIPANQYACGITILDREGHMLEKQPLPPTGC